MEYIVDAGLFVVERYCKMEVQVKSPSILNSKYMSYGRHTKMFNQCSAGGMSLNVFPQMDQFSFV